ncbi:hypothetical protein [Fulvimarina manganoxydans]|uniref:hypothetical protein n=1 Tax=Fulvimarina manganoxydans TaxID=937218 RepID=UPI003CC7E0D6
MMFSTALRWSIPPVANSVPIWRAHSAASLRTVSVRLSIVGPFRAIADTSFPNHFASLAPSDLLRAGCNSQSALRERNVEMLVSGSGILEPLARNADPIGHRDQFVGRVCQHVTHHKTAIPGAHIIDIDGHQHTSSKYEFRRSSRSSGAPSLAAIVSGSS